MIDYNYSNIIISFEKLYKKFQFSSFNLLIQYKQLHSKSNNNNNNNNIIIISGSSVNGTRFVGWFHWKISKKSGKSRKVGPFSQLDSFEQNFVSMYMFLVVCTSSRSKFGFKSPQVILSVLQSKNSTRISVDYQVNKINMPLAF